MITRKLQQIEKGIEIWSRDQIPPAPELARGGLHSPVTYNMIQLYTIITCHRENSNSDFLHEVAA